MSYCLNILTRSHKFGVERKRTVSRKGAGGGGAAPGRKEREVGKTKQSLTKQWDVITKAHKFMSEGIFLLYKADPA